MGGCRIPVSVNDWLSVAEGVSSRKGWMLQCGVMLIELSGIFFNEGWVDMDKNRVLAEKEDIEFRIGF